MLIAPVNAEKVLVDHRIGYSNYPYTFQGQESDSEVKGAGNSVNYKYRMHDPRVGSFFAIDPLMKKYPHLSPYSFSGNRVIDSRELEGLEPQWILSWYNLTPSDISEITDGMSEGMATTFASTADKVKQMHDNYINGNQNYVEFTPQEMRILSGGDMTNHSVGGDGVRTVTPFATLKNENGQKATDKDIGVYPFKMEMSTVHGETMMNGLIKGVGDPFAFKQSQYFSNGTSSMNNFWTYSKSDARDAGLQLADKFISEFKKTGFGGGSTEVGDIGSIDVFVWSDKDRDIRGNMGELQDALLSKLRSELGDEVKINFKDMGGGDYENSVSISANKK